MTLNTIINFCLKLVFYPLIAVSVISLPVVVILAIVEGLYTALVTPLLG